MSDSSWRRHGSFRQRARVAERATRQCGEQRKIRHAQRTHEHIQEFEESLHAARAAARQAADAEIDDLPLDAEASDLLTGTRPSSSSGYLNKDNFADDASESSGPTHGRRAFTAPGNMRRAASDLTLRRPMGVTDDPRHSAAIERDPHTIRPPSPLGIYDYGAISQKPRSLQEQQRRCLGSQGGNSVLRGGAGIDPGGQPFYHPGSHFKSGPYGFSLLDPILLPQRASTAKEPPTRHADAGDTRPSTMRSTERKKPRSGMQSSSDIVRNTRGHSLRAERHNCHIDKMREEALLEQTRYERGMFEGRFRDPLLGARPEDALVEPHEQFDWLESSEEMGPAQRSAVRILLGLERAVEDSRGKLSHLLKAEDTGAPGVLEPEDFLRGLVRVGVLYENELDRRDLIDALTIIDPRFDGRVCLPVLSRAIAAVKHVRGQQFHAKAADNQNLARVKAWYGESLPVDIVKVDRNARSLFNFERQFEKFRGQQRELLAQHKELTH